MSAFEPLTVITPSICKTIVFVLLISLCSLMLPTKSFAAIAPSEPSSVQGIHVNLKTLPDQDLQFLKKLAKSGIYKEFTFTNGHLGLASSFSVLQTKYQLSNYEMQKIQATFDFDQSRQVSTQSHTVSPQIFVRNGSVLYFNNWETSVFLVSAAEAGPWAFVAALEFVATLIGGVVGTTVTSLLAVLGGGTLANLCYLTIQAYVLGHGIYLGIAWTPWPNYTQGYW